MDKTSRGSRTLRCRKIRMATPHHEASQSNLRIPFSQLPDEHEFYGGSLTQCPFQSSWGQDNPLSDGSQDHHKKLKMDTPTTLDEHSQQVSQPSWLSISRNTNNFYLTDERFGDLFPKYWSPSPIEFLYQKTPSSPPNLPQTLENNTEDDIALAMEDPEATLGQDRELDKEVEFTELSLSPKIKMEEPENSEALSYSQENPFQTCSSSHLSESSDDLSEEALQLDSDPEEALVTLEELFQNMTGPGQQMATPAQEAHNSFFLQLDPRTPDEYVNSLDYLLQEKKNQTLGREEWEKPLSGDDHSLDSLENAGDDFGMLTHEHRLLVEKFCVKLYMIPNLHPGEVVFLSQNHFLSCTLDCTNLVPQNSLEELFFSFTFAQQVSFLQRGLLGYLYFQTPSCPVPVLQWLFQLLTWPIETSAGAFRVLWDLYMYGIFRQAGGDSTYVWYPKLQEIIMAFQSLGARGPNLYPKASLQAKLSVHDKRLFETDDDMSSREQKASTPDTELETSLSYICKFLTLCIMTRRSAYTDGELLSLMYLLCRASLDRQLRLLPSADLQQLLLMLLEDVKDWSEKLPELCCMLSLVSDHHHNLLAAVQLVLDVTTRGRQLRGQLSLVIIARLLGQTEVLTLWKEKTQLSLLCYLLGLMKPSSLGQHLTTCSSALQNQKQQLEVNTELDQEVCYLCHSLLTMAGMVVGSQSITTDKWGELQQLCVQLERQVTTHIHESPQAMYRTKLKDLAAQTYIRWQELLTQCRPQDQYYNP
ncbi:protein FAM178B [Antechinus flavipes]|uniref:protein FAM178B n=1 Tax=Antechinus flavipes TaxID=38775 RepID=UPI002235AD8E|nr:protein FAM178B [Antechinus flavipes]XP_051832377.1 protein FAM178B [Antechinus flavipes]XP_051832378.1 protein FAM178B [Antechinus flavipes]